MKINEIEEKIKERQVNPIGVKNEYSVLIPLINVSGEWRVLYELRAKHMETQPGEISFPGGAVEQGETYRQAAVRETMEELGILEENINIIGEVDFLISGNIKIHCFVGELINVKVKNMNPHPDEVDHVFTVPLEFLSEEDPDVYKIKYERNISREFPYNLIPNGKDYNWGEVTDKIYFYKYDGYVIWGFTARMTRNFIDIIKNDPK